MSRQHLSISEISQLFLIRFWYNFKSRFLGLSWTDFNYRRNICPGNIFPSNICPYQEYICSYWLDFDQTLKIDSWDDLEEIFIIPVTFVQAMEYLSCYWPNSDQTLKVFLGPSISTVMVTFVHETLILAKFAHIMNI